MIYDYIIVGAGMGGISAGLNLIKNKKKVLILEKNSLPGGLVSTFKKGRFEFDTSIYDLYNYGNSEYIGDVQTVLNKYGIDLDTTLIPLNINIKDAKNTSYIIDGDFEEFIVKLEEFKEGTITKLKEFLKIIKEIHEAVRALQKNESLSNYPHFQKYIDYTALDGLKDLGLDKEVINRLGIWYLDLGSPLNKLSFIDYALFMYKLIFKKDVIINKKNIGFSLDLVNYYQKNGGKIYYNSYVTDIIEDDGFKVVKTKDNLEYKGRVVICDLAKRYVFKELIKTPNKMVNRLENARSLSPNGVVVYLGLNRSREEIGLNNYKYYHFKNMDSVTNVSYMNDLYHDTWIGYVPNVVNEEASPKNTTILVLKRIYFSDVFDDKNGDINKLKENLANDLVTKFEEAYNIDIREYIEEIEVVTPFRLEKITNSVNGSMFGYSLKGYDNSINR